MTLPQLSKESTWYKPQQCFTIPKQLKPWLLDSGSLTQALINSHSEPFQVEVHYQGKQTASGTEQHILHLPPRQQVLVHEVQLYSGTQATVYARTLIPMSSLVGRARQLSQLGNKPLGAVLFTDPNTRRLAIEITQLTAQHSLYPRASQATPIPPSIIWGRRTLYQYAGQHLLVNEFFMPDIPEHPECHSR
jgi:chorismate--pyruvate lyase